MQRYIRQIQLDEVGLGGQNKLAKAKVLVIGAGGLGCPILQYLASTGVGTLGIVDHDSVSLSNLHRQILYNDQDIGKHKALVAQRKLQDLNPEIEVIAFQTGFTVDNALKIIKEFDIVVDASDNFVTRYLINDACIQLNKPLVFGALYKFEGQVSVFNYQNGPSYRCLFPDPPKLGEVPNCNEIGVLGVLPGIIGLLQANEVIKMILGIGEVLSGRLLYINALSLRQQILKFSRNEERIDSIKNRKLQVVATDDCIFTSGLSLHQIDDPKNCLWVDVRELDELPEIIGKNILKMPLSNFKLKEIKFSTHQRTVFFCQSGVRSQKAKQLAADRGCLNVFGLREGAQELQKWLNNME